MTEPMITNHIIRFGDSRDNFPLKSNSVDLIITSPPYPMIEMWDMLFFDFLDIKPDKEMKTNALFEAMHQELDKVWSECYRVLKPGGFACLNIGDAVRTFYKTFQLFPNHARVMDFCMDIGLIPLPLILWRKPTNAPNKFMGSGMLPAGAYVTLENEYILIFRKMGKRTFLTPEDKLRRKQSAFFWEERNQWFSDTWSFKGTKQKLNHKNIERSAAFPFELPYRLINMYSLKGDVILDPFLGTGTTSLAAMASGRNSIGIEYNNDFKEIIENNLTNNIDFMNGYIKERLNNHFTYTETNGIDNFNYHNKSHNCPVKTNQEIEIQIDQIKEILLGNSNADNTLIFNTEYNNTLIQQDKE